MAAHPYDMDCDPPCPALTLTIVEPFTGLQVADARGRLDTGSDMTVIPTSLVADLPLGQFRKVSVRGFRGEAETMLTYIVDIIVNGRTVEFVEVVLDGSNDAELLIGRDVLNELSLLLNGPALSAELH